LDDRQGEEVRGSNWRPERGTVGQYRRASRSERF